MDFQIFTLFPEMFPGALGSSLAGKARDKGLWNLDVINIRDYASDKYGTADDEPYGGGAGMVMRADVLGTALDANIEADVTRILYMSPRGEKFSQKQAFELAKCKKTAIICGRFEGIDERVIEEYNIEEISIGDYILSGGELAAQVLMDSCIRLLPGVIKNEEAIKEESFGENADYAGLLEYPLYTRPLNWKGREVPEILLSGHHEKIKQWRFDKAKEITKDRRPDLWEEYNKE